MNYVSYDDFKKMDMRLGLIRCVEPIDGADKLLRFEIDFGPQTGITPGSIGGLGETKQAINCNGTCKKETCEDCEGECTCGAKFGCRISR